MSGDDLEFESTAKKPPIFQNDEHGVTLWADTDKNGDYFMRMRLPLGMGTIPLFVNEAGYEDVSGAFNQLVQHLQTEE